MTQHRRFSRRAWRAAIVGVLVGAGLIAPTPSVATAPVMGVDVMPLQAVRATARLHRVSPELSEFRLFGATWIGTSAEGRVRFHGEAGWGPWHHLEPAGSEDGPDLGSREAGTSTRWAEPVWAGRADGYEVDLPAGASAAKVHLVRERKTRVRVTSSQSQAGAATEAPPMAGRGSWAARPPKINPSYAPNVKVGFVHHTVNSNSYAQGDVPAMLRAIQAYHMDTNGWDDIGYNFLVDRFGGIWEGRAGGIDRAVIGAHAAGFNTGSTGVSVLGDFSNVPPPAAAVHAVSRVLGWKLPLHGVDPGGQTRFTSEGSSKYPAGQVVTLNTISAHRDVGQTACPAQLYNHLPAIIAGATGWAGTVTAYPGFPGGVFVGGGQLTAGGKAEFVTGADAGGWAHVRTFNANGSPRSSLLPYGTGFGGGVRVAAGNVDAAGEDEVVTGAGPGGGPHVRVLRENGNEVLGLMAYSEGFRGGVYVASGNADGLVGDEVITAPGPGGGPHVKVFNMLGQVTGQFMAYHPGFSGGVRVAAADVNGDGVDEIVTAPGPGGGPHVRVFRIDGLLLGEFMAYAPAVAVGVYVGATPGPSGQPDRIVTGPDARGGPHVRVFNGNGSVVNEFLTTPTGNTSGVRVGGGQFDGAGGGDLALSFGAGALPIVRLTSLNGELLLP